MWFDNTSLKSYVAFISEQMNASLTQEEAIDVVIGLLSDSEVFSFPLYVMHQNFPPIEPKEPLYWLIKSTGPTTLTLSLKPTNATPYITQEINLVASCN